MAWKKLDPSKFDQEKEDELLADIDRLKTELDSSKQKIEQADGSTIDAVPFKSVVKYQEAEKAYRTWFLDCLKD